MPSLTTVPVPTEKYCVRELGDETVFLSASGDRLHVLDGVGTFIWQAIDGQRSAGDLLERILAEYEVDRGVAETELLEFLAELADMSLIALAEEPA
jgi:hypothetical protein